MPPVPVCSNASRTSIPSSWVRLFRVNVVGAVVVTSACLQHLGPDAVCAYDGNSRTVGDANAYFAPYSVSKAALHQSIRAWRVAHPDRRFVRVVMGNREPTEFGLHMGDDLSVPRSKRGPRRHCRAG